MASLPQTGVNSNYVLTDAYNMEADMVDFHYFCMFLVYTTLRGLCKDQTLGTQLSN